MQWAPSLAVIPSTSRGGEDQSVIRRLTQISRGIPQNLKAEIRNTPLASNEIELSRLARIEDPKEQRAAAMAYISGEHISIFVPKKPGLTKMTRQQAGEALAKLIFEHVPADLWPKVYASCKNTRELKGMVSALRKLEKAI